MPAASTELPDAAVVNFEYRGEKISEDFLNLVAQYGARAPVAYEAGATLEAYVAKACGTASQVNADLFRKSLTAQKIDIVENDVVSAPEGTETLLVPPCLPTPVQELKPRIAQPGESFRAYYEAETRSKNLNIPFGDLKQIDHVNLKRTLSTSIGAGDADLAELKQIDLSDIGQMQAYADKVLAASSDVDKPAGERAIDAFLAGNNLIAAGAEPDDAKKAVTLSLEKFASPAELKRIGQSVDFAIDQYSRDRPIPSSEWAKAWQKGALQADDTGADQAPDFAKGITWFQPFDAPNTVNPLQIGNIVLTPTVRARTVEIPIDGALLPKGTGEKSTDYVKEILPRLTASSDDALEAEVSLLDAQPIESVTDTTCSDAKYPYWGSSGFIEKFINAAVRSRLLSYRAGKQANSATITIIDSGFVEARDEGAFRSDQFAETGRLLREQAASRDLGRRRVHGTAVAGLTLGGPGLWGLTEALGLDVKILPRKIYDTRFFNNAPIQSVSYDRMEQAIEGSGDIFNVSFASTNKDKMRRFADQVGNSAKLFIVAAGNNNMNNGDRGVNIDLTSIYPQLYSGNNLITVAAYNGTKLATFSNFSLTHVSIAAPGCAIRTWSPDEEDTRYFEERFTGTSYSAPIVTFVSAIVKALLPDQFTSAYWVRGRILASADLLPELAGAAGGSLEEQERGVEDGRLLNPIKAVSVYEDVVEIGKGANRQLLIGRLNWLEDLNELCVNTGLPSDAKLMKVATDPRSGNGENLRVYYMRDKELVSIRCKRNAVTLPVTVGATGETRLVSLADINDIVFRME